MKDRERVRREGGWMRERKRSWSDGKRVMVEGFARTGAESGPRGKGMQDIAAPRDTRGRNLHDGTGDVLQSRSPPTTKSLGSHI